MTDSGPIWAQKGEMKRGVAADGVPTLLTDNTLTNLTPAPAAGQKFFLLEIIVSGDAACYLSLKEETSGTLLCSRLYFPGAGTMQITPRCGIITQTAAKRIQGQLSTTANVSVLINGIFVPSAWN